MAKFEIGVSFPVGNGCAEIDKARDMMCNVLEERGLLWILD